MFSLLELACSDKFLLVSAERNTTPWKPFVDGVNDDCDDDKQITNDYDGDDEDND